MINFTAVGLGISIKWSEGAGIEPPPADWEVNCSATELPPQSYYTLSRRQRQGLFQFRDETSRTRIEIGQIFDRDRLPNVLYFLSLVSTSLKPEGL